MSALLGNLSLNAIPFHNPIIMGAGAFMALVAMSILGAITYFKKWTYLFKEWIFTTDHKKIGIMYIILAFVMMLRGFTDALMMRAQQALAVGHSYGYLPPEHFSQVFTAHGVIMIFFMAMPFMFGLLNVAVPLQIGARDVAFPYLNSLSLWLTVAGAILVNISLVQVGLRIRPYPSWLIARRWGSITIFGRCKFPGSGVCYRELTLWLLF